MASKSLRLVLAQINLTVGDIPGNARRVIEAAHEARDQLDAQLMLFPELCLTGYPPEDLLLRPDLQDHVLKALEQIRREVTGITLVVGHPQAGVAGLYNAATVIRERRIVATCLKQHLPNYSVFDEKRYFVPGAEPCVFELEGQRFGLTICEDIWSPGPAAQLKAQGAQMILNINASPFHAQKAAEREAVVADRVRETGLPVAYLNLVGWQDELVFDGGSFVMDGHGGITQRAAICCEELIAVDLSFGDGEVWPLAGVQAAVLSVEAAIYQVLVLGVRDYARKNAFRGAVLGLSGGIDSALTLAIAVDALGAEQVEAVMMPSRYTAGMSQTDAALQAERLGVRYRVIPIEQPFQSFLDLLQDEFEGCEADVTEENIQARCRGIILMAISNKTGRILLTTGNKSEVAVGYSTLYGDMAGGFAPIKDVPKTLVYRLAEYVNRDTEIIPRRVIERPPSAELRPDQKDEDSLPAYKILDAILEAYVEQDRGYEEIVALGYAPEVVRQVIWMVDRNEYKRRQAPPGVRITRRAFGRDRRYPITSGYLQTQFSKE